MSYPSLFGKRSKALPLCIITVSDKPDFKAKALLEQKKEDNARKV